ncbi:MAG: hypothetical protein WCB73_07860 [Pseudonocardiaceae bacterium]
MALFILDDVCDPARLPVGGLRPRRPGATEHGPKAARSVVVRPPAGQLPDRTTSRRRRRRS